MCEREETAAVTATERTLRGIFEDHTMFSTAPRGTSQSLMEETVPKTGAGRWYRLTRRNLAVVVLRQERLALGFEPHFEKWCDRPVWVMCTVAGDR